MLPRPNFRIESKIKQAGFTLIEMLVVLVILALTTSLLTQGLSTTWGNFERLTSRDLTNSAALLPAYWFNQSVDGAVLYHPNEVHVVGKPRLFRFITFKSPDDRLRIPQQVTWLISDNENHWSLNFYTALDSNVKEVKKFSQEPLFEYLTNGEWSRTFVNQPGKLPLAVRIIVGDRIWSIAKVGRPEDADIPFEMQAMGEYEFG